MHEKVVAVLYGCVYAGGEILSVSTFIQCFYTSDNIGSFHMQMEYV